MLEWLASECADGIVLRFTVSAAGLRSIEFDPAAPPAGESNPSNALLREAEKQLRAYFRGALRRFDLALDLQGTPFQLRVWRHLETIPYGQLSSYSAVAQAIGAPRAVRAVGAANGANPVPIVVPCHRVVGAGGKLVGYGGGLPLKRRLLELESGHSGLFADGPDAPEIHEVRFDLQAGDGLR